MGMPVVLATFFTNLKLVSIYAIYNMVIGGINGMLSVFINGVSASFGEIIARNEIEKLQKTIKEFEFLYYSIVTIVYSIAMITIMPFIRIYTKGIDDINYDIPIIGFLFVLNGLLYNIKTPQGMLVISAGMYKETRKQSTIQSLIIVVGGVILAPMFGLTGILIASILSNIYRDIELMFYIPRNLTKLSVRSTAMRILRIFISSVIICLPFLYINTAPQNYLNWFVNAVGIATYSILVTCIMGFIFDREEVNNIIVRVKFILGGNK
jgi:O-antigen/teichoic acid export membrane protein